LPIVNGKKMCGKRAKDYDLLTMSKPKHGKKPYECRNAKTKLCGNPSDSVPYANVWCIPQKSECPVTNVAYSGSNL
jgi:hypothetical protein